MSEFPIKEKKGFSEALIIWYKRHFRELPWRKINDPYLIWLSEVILQQTRVTQGLPYYQRFAARFPTVQSLAEASEAEVLRLWQGLGYYSRARNLHAAAKQVVTEHDGQFPNTYEALLRLPGVGRYTAAAVASFAFGVPVAVLDGNVYRVLSRVFGIETDLSDPAAPRVFGDLAQRLLPLQDSATYNQAIMEFGALQCTPQTPACAVCPLRDACVARQTGRQRTLPVKTKKTKVRNRYFHYYVLTDARGHLWMRPRLAGDIWQGLYDFHLFEAAKPELPAGQLQKESLVHSLLANGATWQEGNEVHRHVLTHQRLHVRFHSLEVPTAAQKFLADNPGGLVQLSANEVEQVPKPELIVRYLRACYF